MHDCYPLNLRRSKQQDFWRGPSLPSLPVLKNTYNFLAKNRSTIPLPCGWYGVVWDFLTFSKEHTSANSSDSNCRPWSKCNSNTNAYLYRSFYFTWPTPPSYMTRTESVGCGMALASCDCMHVVYVWVPPSLPPPHTIVQGAYEQDMYTHSP